MATQKQLILDKIPRKHGPPEVGTNGIIQDGHHALRAAADLKQKIDVKVVEPYVKESVTQQPVTELPTYGN